MTQDISINFTYPLSVIVLCHSFVNPVEDVETPISTAHTYPASVSKHQCKETALTASCTHLPKKQYVIASKVVNILRPL